MKSKKDSKKNQQVDKFLTQPWNTTAESLLANSTERVSAYKLLKENQHLLTSLECAFLGLEIALKATLAANGVDYPKKHSLGALADKFEDLVFTTSDNANLMLIMRELHRFLKESPAAKKFWTPSYRYSLREVDEERQSYADKAVRLTKKLLKETT